MIFQGLYQKAEALYYMGEFEFALVFYHRGQKLRPQIQEFRLGIQKAQEAIENSVGSEYFHATVWFTLNCNSTWKSSSRFKFKTIIFLWQLLDPSSVKLKVKGDLSFLQKDEEVGHFCGPL